jgi:glycosyltransferase involved in cell wall biosynthesis
MRIVIDMQGAQTLNQFRGIGRYTLSLSRAIARNRSDHEIFLALNGLFTNTIEPIRAVFDDLLPQDNIRIWNAVAPVASNDVRNNWRRRSAELIREAFLASLSPDVVQVSSLFEGYSDDAATSIGQFSRKVLTAVTLYDLIPYIHRKPYLENPAAESWYLEKIENLRRADLWLAISESSRREGIDQLSLPDERTVNISADADAHFQPHKISARSEQALRQKYGLSHPFLMYTGGIDHRKNIEGLIRAFSKIPKTLLNSYQLAIVCSASGESRQTLSQLAAQQGLSRDHIVFTGFVPEEDLLALYNLCSLFVFPSWHEGFGLPALEAMRCGAPVVGANTSSMPEVIGWDEALFDPHSDDEMTAIIERALSDTKFHAKLLQNSKRQSALFSWDETARSAIEAMECLFVQHQAGPKNTYVGEQRPKLAYVSPFPPEKSGIADYSADLLPELSRYYEIDVIVAQDAISDQWVMANCSIHSIQWFVENFGHFNRVVYHIGNSTFHQHMFELLKAIPGVVVLHDFYLSGLLAHMDTHGFAPGCWEQELYNSHGYVALFDLLHAKDTADVVYKYPCSLSVIQSSLGVIVHSLNSIRLSHRWYGKGSNDWAVVPLMRNCQISMDKGIARKKLGIDLNDFLVCSFGILGPTKLNQRLLQAWFKSRLARDDKCHLVFVGENPSDHYGQALLAMICHSPVVKNIHITGWTAKEVYHRYLAAADVGVQLRTLSRGETSAAVLDCMNYGLATIVNANGSMAFLEDKAVWKLPDEFSDEQLVEALETLWQDTRCRGQLCQTARGAILKDHNPRACCDLYCEAIERFYRTAASGLPTLPHEIASIKDRPPGTDLIELADAIARSFPPVIRQKQLLVDISELVQRDARSGIQRVVRSILKEWLSHPPTAYRVEPVYASVNQGYRYARRFTLNFIGYPDNALQDDPIDYAPGDVFFGLDLQPQVVPAQRKFFQALRRHGVQVKFAVYDLLCILMPQHFPNGAADGFSKWLEVVAESDGAWCISKSVGDELTEWVKENGPERLRPFTIVWSHLGAAIPDLTLACKLPVLAEATLTEIRKRTSFIIVGTLEPRKGHSQVLEAFERLWLSGVNVNLVIVGKHGWLVDSLEDRLRAHPEWNKRLFWLEGISDEYLEKIYAASTCLIAASYGEGFGLPLIEAAQHNKPIIARDIPVFREVAGEHAFYFEGKTSIELAQSITEWLKLHAVGQHPMSNSMPWLSWKESAAQLKRKILDRAAT